jgi:hypothetical protein
VWKKVCKNISRRRKKDKSALQLARLITDPTVASLNLPEAYFTCEAVFLLPDAFADGGDDKGAS